MENHVGKCANELAADVPTTLAQILEHHFILGIYVKKWRNTQIFVTHLGNHGVEVAIIAEIYAEKPVINAHLLNTYLLDDSNNSTILYFVMIWKIMYYSLIDDIS